MKFQKKIKVTKKISISEKDRTFIIAEIGSNHNQSLTLAKKHIIKAKNAGADAVKFQSLNLEETIHRDVIDIKTKKLYHKISFNENWYSQLSKFCKKKGIIFFSTPTYKRSIQILKKINTPIYKIASTNFGFNPKRDLEIINTNKPVLISLGLSTIDETEKSLKKIQSKNKKIILLHCVSRYPTKINEINLGQIKNLREKFNCLVGFSDHTMSIDVPSYAVACGAKVIEKHFTLSRKLKGPDHFYALEPKEFKQMVKKIRETEMIYNFKNFKKKKFVKEEKFYRKYFSQKIIATKNLKKNEVLKIENLDGLIYEKNKGIDCKEILKLKGLIAKNNIKKGTVLEWKSLKKKI